MSDAERLSEWFADGRLVRPDAPGPTTVDLIHALAGLAGVSGLVRSAEADRLATAIGPADNYVFVLIDGLGVEQLARAPSDGFLAAHAAAELRAVFPSTTAAALTSFATGRYPAAHGVLAWTLYLREHELVAKVMPFIEAESGGGLVEWGVRPEDVYRLPPLLPRFKHAPLTVTPAAFADGVYVRYASGGTPVLGYEEMGAAVEGVVRHVREAPGPSYTSLYLPLLDDTSHAAGPDAPEVGRVLVALDALIAELGAELRGRARLVVAADHGQVAVAEERQLLLSADDPLSQLLVCPPAGEPTVPFFHLKPGQLGRFRDGFGERYGDAFALITPDEAESLSLFGPGRLSELARWRLGELIGIAPQPTALYYERRGERVRPLRGVHAGLTRGEIFVPLILA